MFFSLFLIKDGLYQSEAECAVTPPPPQKNKHVALRRKWNTDKTFNIYLQMHIVMINKWNMDYTDNRINIWNCSALWETFCVR